MAHYYNEFDDDAASWLEELIFAGEIPYGIVDRRSIEDVAPSDLKGFVQCHFFAGIGGWPLALRLAGFPEDREIWTGSCPCQPFSTAGAGAGFADERHLWPAFYWLISQRRPSIVVGEQVASAAAGPWLDLVLTDLEALGSTVWAYAGPAAGVNAPHIRDRSYWMAHAHDSRLEGRRKSERGCASELATGESGLAGGMAYTLGERFNETRRRFSPGRGDGVAGDSDDERLADAQGVTGGQGREIDGGRHQGSYAQPRSGSGSSVVHSGSGPVNGQWRDADWLGCRDGKWRPVEPGTFPLAHGIPARVGRLRGYGNAIVPQQAAEFIKAGLM